MNLVRRPSSRAHAALAHARPRAAQGVVVVPQQMAWVVERFGRFDRVLEPGLQFLVPLMHSVRYVFSLKEEALGVPAQTAVTRDNVAIAIDGVLYVKARRTLWTLIPSLGPRTLIPSALVPSYPRPNSSVVASS